MPSLIESDNIDYDRFLQRLRHPSCRPMLSQIRKFIETFKVIPARPAQQMAAYQHFMERMRPLIAQHPVFLQGGGQEQLNAMEGLETLICNQIYEQAFCPKESDDEARDAALEAKMVLFGWIKARHLDYDYDDNGDGEQALPIDQFRVAAGAVTSPREKLQSLLEGCKMLANVRGGGADQLLPGVILTLIKARPRQLYSTLAYIKRYRDPERLASSTEYHFTTLMAAMTFIERLDREALLLTAEDEALYDQTMEDSVRQLNQRILMLNERRDTPMPAPQLNRWESKRDLLASVDEIKESLERVKHSPIVTKGVAAMGRMVKGAEEAVNKMFASLESMADEAFSSDSTETAQAMAKSREEMQMESEEFQLQLAMALSLSELDPSADLPSPRVGLEEKRPV